MLNKMSRAAQQTSKPPRPLTMSPFSASDSSHYPAAMDQPVPELTPEEAQKLIDDGALLVDVREQNEWDAARVHGAVLKPMSDLNSWYQDLPRDRQVVLMCRTGNRSGKIADALINQASFTNVHNLTGGIVRWAEEGRPIDEGSE